MSKNPSHSMTLPQMILAFDRDGTVTSNSPKLRHKLYKRLHDLKIEFATTIVGYTDGNRRLCRWDGSNHKIGWDIGRIAKWICYKRLLQDDLEQQCSRTVDSFNFESIKHVFDDDKTRAEIVTIFNREWGDELIDHKWTPFDTCTLKKTIVQIDKR